MIHHSRSSLWPQLGIHRPIARKTFDRRTAVRRRICQSNAATKPGRKSKPAFPHPKVKPATGPPASSKAQQHQRQKPKHAGQQEASDLALLRQQKATSASQKVLRFSGLQRASALCGHSPEAEPFSVALNAFKVTSTHHTVACQNLFLKHCVRKVESFQRNHCAS